MQAGVLLAFTVLSVSLGNTGELVDLGLHVRLDGNIDAVATIRAAAPNTPVAITLPGLRQEAATALAVVDAGQQVLDIAWLAADTVEVDVRNIPQFTVRYRTTLLTSKEAEVWTLQVTTSSQLTLTFPHNTTILDLGANPLIIEKDDPTRFVFAPGVHQVRYRLPQAPLPEGVDLAPWLPLVLPPPLVAAGGYFTLRWYRQPGRVVRRLLRRTPDLHAEEVALLQSLARRGGRAWEADLAQEVQLPKTSAWRHLRRLEERGTIRINKEGTQNRVRLR